ncbi:MAG: cellulose synthase operon protein YhjQ/BcsQ [Terriglobales bacterium]
MPQIAPISRPPGAPRLPSGPPVMTAHQWLAVARRRWRWCLGPPLVAVLLVALAAPRLPSWYQAQVLLRVSDWRDPAAPPGSEAAAAATLAAAAMAVSPQVMAPVVAGLRLTRAPEFAPRHRWRDWMQRAALIAGGAERRLAAPWRRAAASARTAAAAGDPIAARGGSGAAASRRLVRTGAAAPPPGAAVAADAVAPVWLAPLPVALPPAPVAAARSRAGRRPAFVTSARGPAAAATLGGVVPDGAAEALRAGPGSADGGEGPAAAAIAATLVTRFSAQPEAHGDLLTLSYRDPNPQVAAAIANAVAAELQAQVQAREGATLRRRAGFLATQLAAAQGQWRAASQALMAFRAAHAADAADPRQSAAMARLMALSQALTQADVDLWRQQAQVAAGSGPPGPAAVQASAGAQSRLAELWLQRAELAEQESRLAAQYGPAALPLVQARRALASVQDSLARYRRALLSGHRISARADRWEQARLQAAVGREGQLLAAAERNGAQDAMLAARLRARQDLYQDLWRKQRQLILQRGWTAPAVQVLAPATVPRHPVRVTWPWALAAAALLGSLAGLGAVAVGELAAPRLRLDNAAALGVPLLGALPPRTGPGWDRALDDLWITLVMAATQETTLLFTSAGPGEGKTTVVAALAERLQQAGHSVLLLDCHFASPRLTVQRAARPAPGLGEYLSGRCGLEALFTAATAAPVPALAVVPAGQWRPELTGALASPAFARLLAQAAKRFDWVLLDAGAVSAQPEVRLLAHVSDAVILVAAEGEAPFAGAQQAVRTLRSGTAKKLALILNSLPADAQPLAALPTAALPCAPAAATTAAAAH